MPRRRLGPGAALLLLVAALGVVVPAGSHYVDVRKGLAQADTLTVGLALAGRPFSWRENGVLHGFEVDVARAVAESNGLDLALKPMARDRLAAALQRGKVDAITTLALDRIPPGLRLVPFLRDGDFIMVLRGNPFRISTLGDLSGQTVAVTAGSTAADFARAVNDELIADGRKPMDVHSFTYQRDTAFPVNMGHAAAFFVQAVSAVGITRDEHARTRLVEWGFRAAHEAGFGVPADRENLVHGIGHAVAAMVATGRYAALLEQYELPGKLSAYQRND